MKTHEMMDKVNEIKGFKVFNPDWTCRSKLYTCPGTFEEDVTPNVCHKGMHFCERLADCFNYYDSADENYHVAEVIAHGEVSRNDDKCCTNKLEIVREIPWLEVLQIVNIGKSCTGILNTGSWNVGNYNTGSWNTGDYNTGDRNTGNYNTGDWNTSFGSAGCFNTEEQTITLFNKPSNWTLKDWLNSEARYYLNQIPKNVVEWVYSSDMTGEEKTAHPEHKTTGGYLKVLNETECAQVWWDAVSENVKNTIKSLPNFDAEVFKRCTGIDV